MQLDKSEIISEFITQNSERFALAVDIYDNFPNIFNQMLTSICNDIAIAFNQTYPLTLSAPVRRIVALSSIFYFEADIDSDHYIRITFNNYFKQTITLHAHRHNQPIGSEARFNIGALNDIHTYTDIFQVYHNTNGLKDRLVENCLNIFGDQLARMVADIKSDVISNGHAPVGA